jgi:hypothetical protein
MVVDSSTKADYGNANGVELGVYGDCNRSRKWNDNGRWAANPVSRFCFRLDDESKGSEFCYECRDRRPIESGLSGECSARQSTGSMDVP